MRLKDLCPLVNHIPACTGQGRCLPDGVSAQGGVCLGVSTQRECLPGGCLPRGCLPGGVCPGEVW